MRLRIALLVLLLYVGASVLGWLNRAAEPAPGPGQDEVSLYERRFQELRTVLPEGGVVGYQGHPDLTTALPGQGLAHLHVRQFLLTQYALAPVLLIEGTEPEFVVGNFDPGAVPLPPQGLRVVRDFGNGVVLFRRSGSW
jgi:hypothetical protein